MSGTECNNRVLTFIYSTRQTTLRPRERDCDHRTQSVSHLSSEYILITNGGALKHKATRAAFAANMHYDFCSVRAEKQDNLQRGGNIFTTLIKYSV